MIALRDVTKRFGDRVALDHVPIDVVPGTTHVLLGSSGSGKSTVLRLILGLVEPDAGTVLVDGTAVGPSTRAALVGRMGHAVQDGGLYPHLTAYQNWALGAEAQRWPRARMAARVAELAVMAGLDAGLVTHDIREAAVLATTVTLLTAGRVVQHGTFADLVERPATPLVTQFVTAQALTVGAQASR